MGTDELLKAGERCGAYTVASELGRGGFGVVYQAKSDDGVDVALKVMPIEAGRSDDLVARFQREILLVAAITHANLVKFLGAGRHDGRAGPRLWMALEYLQGKTLREILTARGAGLPLEEALTYGVQIADGLAALHARGVVHRDVKPENVMRLGGGLIKVFDLGIAKVSGAQHTTGQVSIGTAAYMAPEQFDTRDKSAVGPWTDVYALGVVLYELVTGKHPICPDEIHTTPEIIARALLFTPPPLAEVAGVPEDLSAALAKAVAKKSAERFRSMQELRDALDAALVKQRLATHAGSLAEIGGDWTPVSSSSPEISASAATTERLPEKEAATVRLRPEALEATMPAAALPTTPATPAARDEAESTAASTAGVSYRVEATHLSAGAARAKPRPAAYGVFGALGLTAGAICAGAVVGAIALVRGRSSDGRDPVVAAPVASTRAPEAAPSATMFTSDGARTVSSSNPTSAPAPSLAPAPGSASSRPVRAPGKSARGAPNDGGDPLDGY